MRIRLTIVDPASSTPQSEVLLQAPSGVRFGDVRPHLAALVADGAGDFALDGRLLPDDVPVGTGGLVRGAVLVVQRDPDSTRRMPLGRAALLELTIAGGRGAGHRFALGRGEHLVGRGIDCPVRLDDPGISRAHAVLTVSDAGVTIRDVEPTNPSLVDGDPLPGAGHHIEEGVRVRMGATTLVLRRQSTAAAPLEIGDGVVRLHRRPRFPHHPAPVCIQFPEPPGRPDGVRLPLVASLAPLALSAVLAVALGSPSMLLFALMSPVLLLGQWWSDRRHGRSSYRRLLAEHRRAMEAVTAKLGEALASEHQARHAEQPDLAAVGALVRARGVRLWERRPEDPDHLVVRWGTADQRSRVVVTGREPDDAGTCVDVPVTTSVRASGVTGVSGRRDAALSLLGGVLSQLCAWHSPRSLGLTILTSSTAAQDDWGWATHLPHLAMVAEDAVAQVAEITDEVILTRRVTGLLELIHQRREERALAPHGRAMVVVLDGAHALRAVPGVATLLRDGPAVDIHFLCLDAHPDLLPAETSTVVALSPDPASSATVTDAEGVIDHVLPDLPTRSWLERLARDLAPLEDATPEPGSSAVPRAVTFRDLHLECGIDPASPGDLTATWSPGGAAAPRAHLGMAADGPFTVDLAQDGPHMLVGGTTGAGKSELLQALVAGLAVVNRPDQLGFVLIDYKGGSAFKECAGLPHTLGVVTDLDESLTTRALTSLGAELKRRERLLAAAGAKDLDEYERLRGRQPAAQGPVARLVLVVDEFKLLADELPDFVSGLVRIAAVGRSLGIHLVLATQRPAGIVSADMRSNVALRVALRVRDRSDSDDVIEGPQACTISDRTPGRAWIRTAGQRLVEVQTAYVGALVDEGQNPAGDPTVAQGPRAWRTDWRGLGRPWPVPEQAQGAMDGQTQLAAFVGAARAAADALSIRAGTSPWLPPLPTAVSLDALPPSPRLGPVEASAGSVPVRLGLVDLPDEQRQEVLTWNTVGDGHLGVAGGARSGRSTTLTSIALELASRWSPSDLHIQVLAGTGSPLGGLRDLPHVGSVVGPDDPLLARRLVLRLLDEAASRSRPGPTGPAASLVVVLVDGWESIEDAFDDVDHGAPSEDLLRLMRDGQSAGIRVVITGGRSIVSGRLSGLLQRRLVLPMPDPLDLTLAGIEPGAARVRRPPGRAIDLQTGAEVQLAHPGATPTAQDQLCAIESVSAAARARHEGVPRSALPWRLEELPDTVELAALGASPGLVRLGLADDGTTVAIDLSTAPGTLLVMGPPRSGRSTTLTTVAMQLAERGRPVAVITTRRSPLAELGGIPGVHVLSAADTERFVALRRTSPELGILVDDAEGIDGTPIEPALLEATRLIDDAGGYLAAAVDVHRAAGLFRGLVVEIARHCSGLILSPTSPSDGDLLRTRVEVPRHRPPGRGVAVIDGVTRTIQVARAAYPSAADQDSSAAAYQSVPSHL